MQIKLFFQLLALTTLLLCPLSQAAAQSFTPDPENPLDHVRVVPNPLDIGSPGRVIIDDPEVKVPPMGLFDKKPIFFFQTRKGWTGIFGADIMLKPNTMPLLVNYEKNDEIVEVTQDLTLITKDYGVRVINVPQSQVELSPEDQKRAAAEKKLVDAALATVSPDKLWHGEFLEPVNASINSSFGRRTRMNGVLNPRPHAGADYRAPEGAPVRAPATGRVILTGNHFFAGNSIYIDHGQGLISMYFHLSEILVTDGQMVNKGDEPIGLVGKTGRVTGAHLHYGIYLNSARIDPSVFRKLTTTLDD
jgi:hypothetical protein